MLSNFLLYLQSKSMNAFYYYDVVCDYFCPTKPKNYNLITGMNYKQHSIYDIYNDIIIINYKLDGVTYTLHVDRKHKKDIPEIMAEIESHHEENGIEDYYLSATIQFTDRTEDITHKLNRVSGPDGIHLNYSSFNIKWMLDPVEISEFQLLETLNKDVDEHEYTSHDSYLKTD